MGNICGECDFQSNQWEGGAEHSSTGNGYGLFQWSYGRTYAMRDWAKARHKDPADIPTQVAYMRKEYDEGFHAKLTPLGWDEATSPGQACKVWMLRYEINSSDWASFEHFRDLFMFDTKRAPAARQMFGWFKDATVRGGVEPVPTDTSWGFFIAHGGNTDMHEYSDLATEHGDAWKVAMAPKVAYHDIAYWDRLMEAAYKDPLVMAGLKKLVK
jgi:hypothetical protein